MKLQRDNLCVGMHKGEKKTFPSAFPICSGQVILGTGRLWSKGTDASRKDYLLSVTQGITLALSL